MGAIAPVRGVTEFLPQSNRVYLPDGVAPALQSTSATRNGDHVPFVLAFGGNDTRGPIPVATACNAKGGAGRSDFESETFVVSPAHAFDARQSDVIQYGDMAGPLDTCGSTIGVLTPRSPATFLHCNKGRPAGRRSAHTEMVTVEVEVVPTITTDGHLQSALVSASAVRRLTPVECERLQGFPDGYTAITYRGKPAADGPRYAAIGNSWATSVVRWIGQRIKAQLQ